MIKLKKSDPVAEVFDLLRANNPMLNVNNSMIVRKLTDNATGKNTTLSFILDGIQGLIGISTINYDRVDIGKIFNQFVGVNKVPSILIFGTAGATVQLSSLLDQLNTKLGTAFIMTGNYADLKDQTITIPAKSGSIDIDVVAQSTANGFPSSLRVKPGSTMKIRLSNSGKRISDMAVVRSMYPLVKADNNLNSAVFTMAKAAVKKYAPLDLRLVDFSTVFNNLYTMFSWVWIDGGSGYVKYDSYLSSTAINAINAKLTSLNLPAVVTNAKLPGDGVSAANYWQKDTIYVLTGNDNVTWKTNKIVSLCVKTTASLAGNPLVNTEFTHVLILPKSTYGMVDTTGVVTGDYYLHFNM